MIGSSFSILSDTYRFKFDSGGAINEWTGRPSYSRATPVYSRAFPENNIQNSTRIAYSRILVLARKMPVDRPIPYSIKVHSRLPLVSKFYNSLHCVMFDQSKPNIAQMPRIFNFENLTDGKLCPDSCQI